MRQLTALLVLMFFFSTVSIAQKASIKGSIRDTANQKQLENAVISLVKKTDSTLISFTRSDAKGNFTLPNLSSGQFVVWISYPKFADYVDDITLGDTSDINLGQIKLTLKSQLLEEVIVKQQLGAIRFKKDTIEYVADSFKLRANATVEDLLKQLPGIQVNKDGKITAQGTSVQKVLVDGEEFFGDDPTVATRNINADAVDKVQVFDKKSDQAAFTGIDDGNSQKTVNLKLKEDKKKGYFGKLSAAGGLNRDNYNNSAMFNAFKSKRKFSAYGIMSNTGKTGLDWSERTNYGGGNNMEYMEEYGGFVSFGDGDEDFGGGGSYYGEGLPKSWSGGLHYSNKWKQDKLHLNSGYQFNKLNTMGVGGTFTQNILPDTTFFNDETREQFSSKLRHTATAMVEIQLDSSSSLKFNSKGYVGKSITDNQYSSTASDINGNKGNTSRRNNNSDGTNGSLNSSLLWRKKFEKKGRTLSWNFQQNYRDNNSTGFNNSEYLFYNKLGDLDSAQEDNQKRLIYTKTSTYDTRATYTEPLSKTSFIEVNYGISSSNSNARRTILDKQGNVYDKLVDSLSNEYSYDILTNSGGLAFRMNKKKYNLSIGSNLSHSAFKQTDLEVDTIAKYSFVNLFPKANLTYNFSQFRRFSFNYNGSTRQPSLNQLQPIPDNSNQLYIVKGNPELKQEFRHNFRMNFSDFKVLNDRSIWVSLNFTSINNAIGNSDSVFNNGARISQAVNVTGNYNGSAYVSYGLKLKKINMNLNANLNTNMNRFTNYVNGQKNVNNNNAYTFGLWFGKYKENKYNFGGEASLTYNYAKIVSPGKKNVITKFWTYQYNIYSNVTLPKKFEIGSDVEISIRQKTVAFDRNNNVTKWNASAGKKFGKNDAFLFKFAIYDILDQNIGFRRSVNSNFITETTYETLRRYWQLSLTWNFSKNGKPAQW